MSLSGKHLPYGWPCASLQRGMLVPGLLAVAHAGYAQQAVTIPSGVPLHVRTTRSAPMRVGARVDGVLSAPVWVYDRPALATGAVVHGVVTALEPAPRGERTHALMDGDLTPLRMPIVNFDHIETGSSILQLKTHAEMRQTQLVRFVAQPKASLRSRVVSMAKERINSVREAVFSPGKGDRALHLLYSQLPYHPQRIWRGTEFIADLDGAAALELEKAPEHARIEEAALASSLPPNVVVKARLITALDSETARHGDVVSARMTEPLFDRQQQLLLPEGTELQGEVLRAKTARSFARNGTLQFTFRGVRPPGEELEHMRGTLTGADGSKKENLTVDAEGDVKAEPDKNRFVAPLLLGLLAVHGQDDDGGAVSQVVASNGLGLVARVIALTVASPNVATGFGAYGFAKSIWFRFIARGHSVTFPKDTLLEVQLSQR